MASLFTAALLACGPVNHPADTVVYASGSDLESPNPLLTVHNLAKQVQRHALFVTLARYDAELVPRPYAARGWAMSPDRLTLTVFLRPGLTWHDGRPLTALDAAFTIEAAKDPEVGYPRAGDLAMITEVRVVDDSTLLLRYRAPLPDFPPVFCELPIIPRHHLSTMPRAGWRSSRFESAPVGAGPFRFVERRRGQRWVFERNETFPEAMGGPPRIRRLVVAVVDEATTKFAGLVSGSLDVAGISPAMANLAREDRAVRVLEYPILQSVAVILNASRPPFDDARVREALSLSVDRDRIVEVALAGYATPAAGPVPDAHPMSVAAAALRDPSRADSLLEAAGWVRGRDGVRVRDGIPFTMELLTVGTADNAVEQLLQADASARGIRLTIRQLEMGAFLVAARSSRKEFDAIVTGVPGDLTLSHLSAMYDGTQRGGALDYGDFHTARLDSLFTDVRSAPDPRSLRAAWLAVQDELNRQTPAVWLYHARGVQGLSARLAGVTMDLRGELATLTQWRTDSAGVTR